MGCTQMKKKKQNHFQDGMADSLNTQHQMNPLITSQANSYQFVELHFIQSQSKVLPSYELQNEKIPKILSSQAYREIRQIKKNKYKLETIGNLLGEEKECYRLRDDNILGSSVIASTFSSPLKKQLAQNENKSIKTLKRKTSDNLVRMF